MYTMHVGALSQRYIRCTLQLDKKNLLPKLVKIVPVDLDKVKTCKKGRNTDNKINRQTDRQMTDGRTMIRNFKSRFR